MTDPQRLAEASERRKIRRGTQSCWQCKTRKVRCNFVVSKDGTCDNCRRRGTLCLSQRYPNVSTCEANDNPDRISRVETRVKELAQIINDSDVLSRSSGTKRPQDRVLQEQVHFDSTLPQCTDQESIANFETPVCTANDDPTILALHQAWPSQFHLDAILAVPVNIIWCLRGLVCTSSCSSTIQDVISTQELLQRPPPDLRPTLIARRLLLLSLYFQAIPPDAVETISQVGFDCHKAMTNAVRTANRYVNCNDDLVNSVEGIECLALESMYYDNTGELRRSWLCNRRAMSIAQNLGLHRPSVLITAAHGTLRSDHVWFRLVRSDRYLSLMLGLPQGSSDESFTTDSAMAECGPAERLQRLECFAAGRILQRNEANIVDFTTTEEIDKLLQTAMSSMEPQWWLVPNFSSNQSDLTEQLEQTNRILDQLAHYHLVARLHLPYLLRTSGQGDCDYNKITAVNASREALARFLIFHRNGNGAIYCRGINYLTFFCSTTICLAHIDGNRRDHLGAGVRSNSTFSRSLVHSRATDIGMVERAVEALEKMTRDCKDSLASHIAFILRRLLIIEGNAANGYSYRINCLAREGVECGGDLSDNDTTLQVEIPSFGSIKIECNDSSLPALDTSMYASDIDSSYRRDIFASSEALHLPNLSIAFTDVQQDMPRGAQGSFCDSTLQGVDVAFFDSLVRGSELGGT